MIIFNKIRYIPISIGEKKNKNLINSKLSLLKNFVLTIIIILSFLLSFITKYENKNYDLKNSRLYIKKEKEFLKSLKNILNDGEFFENEMMKMHTTFKIGGPAKYFTKPKTITQITEIILLCKKYDVNYFILGNGSNLLVSDDGYDGVIIQIHEDNFADLKVKKYDENNYSYCWRRNAYENIINGIFFFILNRIRRYY